MSHHIHLVVEPEREASLAEALRDAHTVHAMRFNARTGLSGHVWQGRFYSCPLTLSKGFDGLLAGESWAETSLPGSTLLGPQLDYVV